VLAADQVSKSLVLPARPGAGGRAGLGQAGAEHGSELRRRGGHPVVVMLVSAVVIAVVAVLLARSPSRVAAIDGIHVAGYSATFGIAHVAIRAGGAGAVAVMLGAGVHLRRWLSTCRDAS
jgi:uncharacterized metal-binding protein